MDVDTGADWGTVVIQDQTSERAMWSWGGGVEGEGHVLVFLSSQQLNWHTALHIIWLPRACNVVTVTVETNVDKQMSSWQSDVCTFMYLYVR